MPELPEVETISKDLNKKIPGLKVRDFWTDLPAVVRQRADGGGLAIRNITYPSTLEKFKKEIIGRKILKVYRKGKNVLLDLSGGKLLLIHQKMTGHLLIGKWSLDYARDKQKSVVKSLIAGAMQEKVNNYIHAIFYLSNGQELALSDLRKFAKIMAGDKEQIESLPDLKKLGPDPLELSEKEFIKILSEKKGKIKQVLMDQSVFAGIGNIYSDEILWFAKIHPFARVEKLKTLNCKMSDARLFQATNRAVFNNTARAGAKDITTQMAFCNSKLKNIYKYTKQVLKEAIKLRGTSISDYRDPEGQSGGYDKIRRVYRREGEKCPRCKTEIKRLKMGGRSAHFCPKCQQLATDK